jgi:hypothetical protein
MRENFALILQEFSVEHDLILTLGTKGQVHAT